MRKRRHMIRNTTSRALFSALVLSLILLVPGVWEQLHTAGLSLYNILTNSFQVPALLVGTAVLTALGTVWFIFETVRNPDANLWLEFKEDQLHGMKWRWRYNPSGNGIVDLKCYCVCDDTPLECHEQYCEVVYECKTCKHIVGPIKGDHEQLLRSVQMQIERKLRTGDWRKDADQLLHPRKSARVIRTLSQRRSA